MSDSVASLRHKIISAEDLGSVVRTMKAMAASSIGQYENAVRSLDDYYRTVQLGLAACFRHDKASGMVTGPPQNTLASGVIVFGSDQGLVGQFNEVMVEYVVNTLAALPGEKTIWTVGERIQSRLAETQLVPKKNFILPTSINAITALVGQILLEMDSQREKGAIGKVYLFHHRPQSRAIYTPISQQLLPVDEAWQHDLANLDWPTQKLAEIIGNREQTLRALVREYLFVTLFRSCAESLASENASRLVAMQRAEKNIDELQENLNRTFHRLRQSDIDEELFDVLSGFEALNS